MAQDMGRFLSSGFAGRIKGLTVNEAKQLMQTDPLVGAWDSRRLAAINQIQSLAFPGKGMRITQGEIDTARRSDIPKITDNIETANEKLRGYWKLSQSILDRYLDVGAADAWSNGMAVPSENSLVPRGLVGGGVRWVPLNKGAGNAGRNEGGEGGEGNRGGAGAFQFPPNPRKGQRVKTSSGVLAEFDGADWREVIQ
jgi:hypothetical protein